MTEEEYNRLSRDLQDLARLIPLNWGHVQNDRTDQQINMFRINSFEELERQIARLDDGSKTYFRRRWFLWKCAQCDEHIFCMNENVQHNPNPRDQSYDVEFNGDANLRFDIKGTVVPKQFRDDIPAVIADPTPMVRFFYAEQSRGVRNNIQNRLFIVHHSYTAQAREMYLRCVWDFKVGVYQEYSAMISPASRFINCQGVKADVIFILENLDGTLCRRFAIN